MHLEFQYNRDDYRETLAAHGQQQQKWIRLRQRQGKSPVVRVVTVAALSVFMFLCLEYVGPVGRILFPDIGNLWLKLVSPLICMVVVLLGTFLVTRLSQSGRFGLAEGGIRSVLRILSAFAVLVLCICAPPAIDMLFSGTAGATTPLQDRLYVLAQEILVVLVPWLCIAVFIWTIAYRHAARSAVWETSTHLHRAKTLDIDSDGITITDAVSRSELKWLAICEFAESTHLFLLYLSQQQLWFIPKRAFDEADLAAFRHLLQTQIGDGSRPAAFEVLPVAQLAQPPVAGSSPPE